VGNTSRDQIVGAFFGLGVAYDVVGDPAVRRGVSDLVTRLIGYISRHQWSPDDDITSTFRLRPEALQMLLQVARHINPSNPVSGPFFVLPVQTGVLVDVQSNSSYYKFNLDYMSFYHLVKLQDTPDNWNAYQIVRAYTASHQNAFFNLVDLALAGANPKRDADTRALLDQWLLRPKRDFYVDLAKSVPVCGSEACAPVPVPMRPPADFLWQRSPFQLSGGGDGFVENAGIDYILPYWMARYYGAIPSEAVVQSAAAASSAVAPDSLASLYGTNLVSTTASAGSQPLPTMLEGVMLRVTDSIGAERFAPLVYVSPAQINFLVPDGIAPGTATFSVLNGAETRTATATVRPVVPTLFTMDGNGVGVAAATALVTQEADPERRSSIPVFRCDGSTCVSVPIHLGVDTSTYVTFYGTGIRNRSSLANVQVTINGVPVPVLYAGPAPAFNGLDQVNVELVLALRNAGEANVVLTVDGQKSNTVTIQIQ
jgi:uncharacterized protein (TIGR03437 family)